jgi:hypothetical protein
MLEDLQVLSRNALALNGIQTSVSPRVVPSYCLLRIVLLNSLSHPTKTSNINNLGLHQHPINLPFALIQHSLGYHFRIRFHQSAISIKQTSWRSFHHRQMAPFIVRFSAPHRSLQF